MAPHAILLTVCEIFFIVKKIIGSHGDFVQDLKDLITAVFKFYVSGGFFLLLDVERIT